MSLLRSAALRGAPNESSSERPSLRAIRETLRGRPTGLSDGDAIELLASSDYPNKHRDLEAVLEDVSAPPRVRYLAALSLPRCDPRAAHQILVRATRFHEQRVLAGVMRALGQIGGKEALDAINHVGPNVSGVARAQAEFAAILIAHRLGLEGYAPRATALADVLELAPDAGERLRIRPALSKNVERSLTSLGPRPYGIELAEQPMYEFRCDRCSGMILLNREYTNVDSLAVLRKRSAIFAIGALRDEALGDYSAAALFLTAPVAGAEKISISVHLTNGERVFGGEASLSDGVASWKLHAVRRLGAFPVRAHGSFKDGALDIELAASATRIAGKARPQAVEDRRTRKQQAAQIP
jgi:hypothetical protein